MWWSPHPPLIMMNNSPYLHICQLSLVSCLHLYTVNKSFTVFPLCTRPTCPQSKERVLNNCFSFSLSPSKVFLLYSTFFLLILVQREGCFPISLYRHIKFLTCLMFIEVYPANQKYVFSQHKSSTWIYKTKMTLVNIIGIFAKGKSLSRANEIIIMNAIMFDV